MGEILLSQYFRRRDEPERLTQFKNKPGQALPNDVDSLFDFFDLHETVSRSHKHHRLPGQFTSN